jgi:hypothetical protein
VRDTDDRRADKSLSKAIGQTAKYCEDIYLQSPDHRNRTGYHRNTIPQLRNDAVTRPNHSLRVERRPLDLVRRAI